MRLLFVVAFSLFTLVGCSKRENWLGFYYPDKGDLTVDESLGNFSSLQECRDAATAKIQATQSSNSDYECALNCDTSRGKPYLCEKTEK